MKRADRDLDGYCLTCEKSFKHRERVDNNSHFKHFKHFKHFNICYDCAFKIVVRAHHA